MSDPLRSAAADLHGLLTNDPVVATAGVGLFADALRDQAVAVTETDWQPPMDGTEDDLAAVLADRRRVAANALAAQRMTASTAALVDVVQARDALGLEAAVDVRGLGLGELEDPAVDHLHVHLEGVGARGDAELGGVLRQGHPLGGGDQRLGGHHVREDRGPAEPHALHDGHVRAELPSHEGGLVATRSPADHDDPRSLAGGRAS